MSIKAKALKIKNLIIQCNKTKFLLKTKFKIRFCNQFYQIILKSKMMSTMFINFLINNIIVKTNLRFLK